MVAEVTDSSDWLGTPVASLADVDSALRCQVCKEFLETPMITTCAHTFCALCIRRCLTNEGRCPLCRAPDQPNKLKNNNAMEEVVRAFKKARPEVLQLGKDLQKAASAPIVTGRKRKADGSSVGEPAPASPRKTRSSARSSTTPNYVLPPQEVTDSEDEGEEVVEIPPPRPKSDGLVACPICQKRMAEAAVYVHLDNCQGGQPATTNGQGGAPSFTSLSPTAPSAPKLDPLPGLNYTLMNESALKKKLTSLGIPTSGNKAVLVRRHTEWVNIWNANCDSRTPKLKRELLRDLERWDKSQGKTSNGSSALMEKDFDGKAWATNHSDDFADLIARARQKRKGQSSVERASEEKGDHQANQNQPDENDQNAMAVEPQVERGLETQVEGDRGPQVEMDLEPQMETDLEPQAERVVEPVLSSEAGQ